MKRNGQRRSIRPWPGGLGASLWWLLLPPLLCPPAAAQPGPFDEFFDPLTREPLRLELIVEDDQGRRPAGLEASDFDFAVDGVPAIVGRFRAIDGLRREAGGSPLLPRGEEVTLALVLDRTGLAPEREERLLALLADELLRLLREEDRLLAFVFQEGLRRADVIQGGDPEGAARLRRELERLTGGAPSPAAESAPTFGRLENLRRVLDALGAAPGRRLAVYVGHDPLAVETTEEEEAAAPRGVVTLHPAHDPWGDEPVTGDDPRLDGLAQSAQASLVTLYTLDPDDLLRNSCEGGEPATGDGALAGVATRTGGAAVVLSGCESPRLEPLASDLADYYMVELHLAEVGLDAARDLRIEARSPALSVRHRTSFFDRAPLARAADAALAALLLGRTLNPLDIRVEPGRPQRVDAETYSLPLTVRIPFRQVHFRPAGAVHVGRLHFALGAYNEEGHFTPVEGFDSPLRVANEELPDTLRRIGRMEIDAALRPGLQRVVLTVHDEHAGRTSTVLLELDPEEGR